MTKINSLLGNVRIWAEKVRARPEKMPFILVGNKLDLREAGQANITSAEGEAMAKEIGARGFIETSAKANLNVESAFALLATIILKRHKKKKSCTLI